MKELTPEQEQLANELNLENLADLKNAKVRLYSSLLAFLLGIAGFALLWVYASWQISLGAFLVIWGDNINTNMNINSKIKKALIRFRLNRVNKK
jgi:acetyltransferase-like isoleucine patch superfamily enzyme